MLHLFTCGPTYMQAVESLAKENTFDMRRLTKESFVITEKCVGLSRFAVIYKYVAIKFVKIFKNKSLFRFSD